MYQGKLDWYTAPAKLGLLRIWSPISVIQVACNKASQNYYVMRYVYRRFIDSNLEICLELSKDSAESPVNTFLIYSIQSESAR